jgi:hypothetical protein
MGQLSGKSNPSLVQSASDTPCGSLLKMTQALVTFPKRRLQLWSEFLAPSGKCWNDQPRRCARASFLPDSEAQRVSQIPADAGQNDGFFDAVAFEIDHAGNLSGVG